jgi:Fe-S-cluster containining protein
MQDKLLQNWEVKTKEHSKRYKQFLQKANKNDVLNALPSLHEEAFKRVDCLTCGNCCKGFSPRFKTPDIKRISKALGLRESVFIENYLTLDNEGDFVSKSTPCPFLGADNFCSIYEDRPSDCKRFPYTDEDVFIKRQAITLKNSSFCPAVFYVLEKLTSQLSK